MEDRFKFRAWDIEEDRYASDDDICYDTGGEWDSIYDLLMDDDPYALQWDSNRSETTMQSVLQTRCI